MGIEFKLLGSVQVISDAELVTPNSRIQRMLLALLLLHPNRVVTISRLVDLLWETPPISSNANLRTHVSAVRRILNRDGEDRLLRHAGGYRLVVHPSELDVEEFRQLSSSGRAMITSGDTGRGTQLLGKAVALWRGPAGECLDAQGQPAQLLESLDLERVQVFEEWVDARLQLGEASSLVGTVKAHLAEYPTREHAWGQLMQATYHAGDVAGALTAFNQARIFLSGQLGVEPSTQLRTLHRAMLARDEEALHAQRIRRGFRRTRMVAA